MDKRRKKGRALPPLKTKASGHDHTSQREAILNDEFRALSIGSPLPCTEVSPDPEPDNGGGRSRGSGKGFPTIRVQRCEEAFFPKDGGSYSPRSGGSSPCPAHCQCRGSPPGEDHLVSSPSPSSSRSPSPNVDCCSLRPRDPLFNLVTRNHRTITYYTPRGAANSDTPLLQHTHSDGNIDTCGLDTGGNYQDEGDNGHPRAPSSSLTVSAPGTPVRSLSNPSSPVTSRKGQGHHNKGHDARLLPGRSSEKKPVRLIPLKQAPVPKSDRSHRGELPNLG